MSKYNKQNENLTFDPSQVVVTLCSSSGREIIFQGSPDDEHEWRWLTDEEKADFFGYRAVASNPFRNETVEGGF